MKFLKESRGLVILYPAEPVQLHSQAYTRTFEINTKHPPTQYQLHTQLVQNNPVQNGIHICTLKQQGEKDLCKVSLKVVIIENKYGTEIIIIIIKIPSSEAGPRPECKLRPRLSQSFITFD